MWLVSQTGDEYSYRYQPLEQRLGNNKRGWIYPQLYNIFCVRPLDESNPHRLHPDMSRLPTLVFVPGSWHKPSCYSKITKPLQDRYNLRCVSVTLPTTAGDPAATFKDDLDAAREAISGETSNGRDVVVVAHSYGGMVANSAIKDFTTKADKDTPGPPSTPAPAAAAARGHAIGLILIASGFTLTGVSFMDPFLGRPPPAWRANRATGFAELVTPPRELFYHDLPADEAERWVAQLTPQSLRALFEGGEHSYAGWVDVPSWYIGTVQDRGLPVAAQRMSVGMAREMGASVVHRELPTSHSPFLSRPEETLGLVVQAVEAFTGTALEEEQAPQTRTQSSLVAVPEVRLLQPITWYRFGLPMLFGRVLGRGILIFGGLRSLFRRSK